MEENRRDQEEDQRHLQLEEEKRGEDPEGKYSGDLAHIRLRLENFRYSAGKRAEEVNVSKQLHALQAEV